MNLAKAKSVKIQSDIQIVHIEKIKDQKCILLWWSDKRKGLYLDTVFIFHLYFNDQPGIP